MVPALCGRGKAASFWMLGLLPSHCVRTVGRGSWSRGQGFMVQAQRECWGFGLPWPMSPGCGCPVLDGGHCVLWPVTSGVTAGTAGMPVSPTPSHWWPVALQAPRCGHHGGLGRANFSPHLLQVTLGPQGDWQVLPS